MTGRYEEALRGLARELCPWNDYDAIDDIEQRLRSRLLPVLEAAEPFTQLDYVLEFMRIKGLENTARAIQLDSERLRSRLALLKGEKG